VRRTVDGSLEIIQPDDGRNEGRNPNERRFIMVNDFRMIEQDRINLRDRIARRFARIIEEESGRLNHDSRTTHLSAEEVKEFIEAAFEFAILHSDFDGR
jgi:hypothetical protein